MIVVHPIIAGQVHRQLRHPVTDAVAHGRSHRTDRVHQLDVLSPPLRVLKIFRVEDVLASAAAGRDQQHDLAPAGGQLVAKVGNCRFGTDHDGHPDAVHLEQRPLLRPRLKSRLQFRRPEHVLALDQEPSVG